MTIQERIDSHCIMQRFREGWKEGTIEELTTDYPFMNEFVDNILPWRGRNRKIGILKSTETEKYYYVYLYTERAKYTIDFLPKYMGCDYTCRIQGILEDWNRGNDFPDGDCNAETFRSILYAILFNELEDIDDGSKPPRIITEDDSKPEVNDSIGTK